MNWVAGETRLKFHPWLKSFWDLAKGETRMEHGSGRSHELKDDVLREALHEKFCPIAPSSHVHRFAVEQS